MPLTMPSRRHRCVCDFLCAWGTIACRGVAESYTFEFHCAPTISLTIAETISLIMIWLGVANVPRHSRLVMIGTCMLLIKPSYSVVCAHTGREHSLRGQAHRHCSHQSCLAGGRQQPTLRHADAASRGCGLSPARFCGTAGLCSR